MFSVVASSLIDHHEALSNAWRKKFTKRVSKDDNPGQTERRVRKPGISLSKESLKRAIEANYREMHQLQNYCTLNYTGFVKILKKHDKSDTEHPLLDTLQNILHDCTFFEANALTELISELELDYADIFCQQNILVAQVALMTKREEMSHVQDFHFNNIFICMHGCIHQQPYSSFGTITSQKVQ